MGALDWEDLWVRLRVMLRGGLVLGGAGLLVGLFLFGVEIASMRRRIPGVYRDLYRPSGLHEALADVGGWISINGWTEAAVFLPGLGGVIWLYLGQELTPGRRLVAAAMGVAGVFLAYLVDLWFGWGETDKWVRFGMLSGGFAYLGIGLAARLQGGSLFSRVIEGGLTGAFIGLASAYAAEIGLLGSATDLFGVGGTVVPAAVCGFVVGFTLKGTAALIAGTGPLADRLRSRWPLAVAVLLVLVNTLGPVLLLQHWFKMGEL